MRQMSSRGAVLLGVAAVGAAIGAGGFQEGRKTSGLAKARVELARRIYRTSEDQVMHPPAPPAAGPADAELARQLERLAVWSRHLMEAELDLDGAKASRVAALEGHLKRLKSWEDICGDLIRGEASNLTQLDLDKMSYHRLDAEYRLAEAKEEE